MFDKLLVKQMCVINFRAIFPKIPSVLGGRETSHCVQTEQTGKQTGGVE